MAHAAHLERLMPEFALALVICFPLAMAAGRDIWQSFTVLLGVWLAWCGFIILTGIYEPWHFGIVLDGLAARILLNHPSCRMKAVLGGSYCVQIAMHVAYGIVIITNGEPNVDAYYDRLSIIAWAQLVILGIWAGGNIGGRILRYWHPRPDRFDPSHHSYHGGRR